MLESVFELTVMFFGLTNSLVTFQAMMNNLLRNMIEAKNIVALVLRSVKNIQKFLRLENYYKLFVKNFARVAKSLYKMIRKDVKWNWRERQQKAFEKLKKRFITELLG